MTRLIIIPTIHIWLGGQGWHLTWKERTTNNRGMTGHAYQFSPLLVVFYR